MNNKTISISDKYFYGLPVPIYVAATWNGSNIRVDWLENYTPDVYFEVWGVVDEHEIFLGRTSIGASSFECLVDCSKKWSVFVIAYKESGYSGKSQTIHLPFLFENNLPAINTDSLGTSELNTPYQNSLIINNAIAAGIYGKIIIGTDPTKIYEISEPICPSNCEIIVGCILKMMNSVTDLVAVNVVLNDTTVTVTDATKFHVNEYVAVSDDLQFIEFGKNWGWSGKILNIVGNVITLDTIAPNNYSVADNAYIATLQSNFLVDTVTKVTLSLIGGYIDNNKTGQALIHPTYKATNGTIVEAYKAACGIAVWKSQYVKIDSSIIVRNASMHGISFSSDFTGTLNQYISLGSVKIYDSCEKGVHLKWTSNGVIYDPYIENCVYQDGLIFYSTCDNWIVGNIIVNGCGRSGFSWNSTNNNCFVKSILIFNSVGYGLNISTNDIKIDFCYLYNSRMRITDVLIPGANYVENIYIKQLYIMNTIQPIGDPDVLLYGKIKNLFIEKFVLSNSQGVGLRIEKSLIAPFFITDSTIYGGIYYHTGAKTNIDVGSNINLIGSF